MTIQHIEPCDGCCEIIPFCCSQGSVSAVLHVDFTSACTDWNGSFDVTYDGGSSTWIGYFPSPVDGEICGSACSQKFQFSCVDLGESGLFWQIIAIAEFTGCEEGSCRAAGFRRAASGTGCDPLDITLSIGTMTVNQDACSCCNDEDTITARVYE